MIIPPQPAFCSSTGRRLWSIWHLIGWRGKRSGWSLQWHPHTKACRYGWYYNPNRTGLTVSLNLPILGDFSLWL